MNCKDRLTIRYDGLPVPKELCSIDSYGEADDCSSCDEVCKNSTDVIKNVMIVLFKNVLIDLLN